jgi:hypothetical protein
MAGQGNLAATGIIVALISDDRIFVVAAENRNFAVH